jgi:hypothetical protein
VAYTFFIAWVMDEYWEERDWKGIPSRPLIGTLPEFAANLPRIHHFEVEKIATLGRTIHIRIGDVRGLWISDPADVEYMLKTNQQNFEQGVIRKCAMKMGERERERGREGEGEGRERK